MSSLAIRDPARGEAATDPNNPTHARRVAVGVAPLTPLVHVVRLRVRRHVVCRVEVTGSELRVFCPVEASLPRGGVVGLRVVVDERVDRRVGSERLDGRLGVRRRYVAVVAEQLRLFERLRLAGHREHV